jgi:hypothetical protein
MELHNSEIALVLAGLRLLQEEVTNGGPPKSVMGILEDAGMENCQPEDIDRLCEKINC